MIDVMVYNKEGKGLETLKVKESDFGGIVRYSLLKQAIVRYHANHHLGSVQTKSRSMVKGSSRKLFRQKGTGNARVGNIRTGKRVGGGMIFAKVNRDFSKRMPKKQRQLARNSAILAKLMSKDIVVVDQLDFERPKTKDFVSVLNNLKIDRSCLVASEMNNDSLYKSARNVPRIAVMPVTDLNAGDICNYRKILFTKAGFMSLIESGKKD